jgi:hypothetical protein
MTRKKSAAKSERPPETLKGWKAIAAYLGIGEATAQHWAKNGMPVRREGRYTVATPDEISRWLGKEAHMPGPAHVATAGTDMAAALKDSISAVRTQKRKG